MKPGVYQDMPADDYHAVDAVSSSMLKEMARSPYHCWAMYHAESRPERKQTPAMAAGTLLHTLVLEPHTMDRRYAVWPEGLTARSKRGEEWLMSLSAGVTAITEDQLDVATQQKRAIMAVPELAAILKSGKAEQSVFWRDRQTGLLCKARPDFVHTTREGRAVMLDLKSSADESPGGWPRSIANFGYHRQRAHYLAGWQEATRQKVDAFVFGVVSSSYPFVAVPYVLDDETEAIGADEVRDLLQLYADCRRTNEWPAYGRGLQMTGLPVWAKPKPEIEVSYV